ncbi:hypothetical protein B296_00002360, partial [Ensete ventricosum]
FEGFSSHDERRERKSDIENSEDERRTRIGSLKKKAINASTKFRHSLKKKNRRKSDGRVISVSIEDIRNIEELEAVLGTKYQNKLLEIIEPRFVGIQMVLSGEAQCARQIVAVSNGEGKIIAYAKPQYPTVSSLI